MDSRIHAGSLGVNLTFVIFMILSSRLTAWKSSGFGVYKQTLKFLNPDFEPEFLNPDF